MSTQTIDLTDVDAFVEQRHHAMFAWLRANDPVFWNPTPDGGIRYVTDHDSIDDATVEEFRQWGQANGVRVLLSEAAVRATANLVEINLATREGDERVERARDLCEQTRRISRRVLEPAT